MGIGGPAKKFHCIAGVRSEKSALAGTKAAALAGLAPLVRASKDDFDGGKHTFGGVGKPRHRPGRDRVRKSLYAAAESSLGRGVSPLGMHACMHAALIGDNGLDNDWVLSRSPTIATPSP